MLSLLVILLVIVLLIATYRDPHLIDHGGEWITDRLPEPYTVVEVRYYWKENPNNWMPGCCPNPIEMIERTIWTGEKWGIFYETIEGWRPYTKKWYNWHIPGEGAQSDDNWGYIGEGGRDCTSGESSTP